MSIENQIERINQNISNTYTELEALGADAPDVKNSENLASTVQSVKAILYTEQDLTEDQKEQARKNVDVDPKGTAAAAVSAHNTSTDAHTDMRQEIKAIREQLMAFLDVDEETLNELSELIARIVSNQTSIAQLTTGKVNVTDIIDNLTTNVANKPLSAAQGVVIKTLIDGLASGKLDASKLTEAINTALAQAKANGEFDGADGQRGLSLLTVTTAPSSYTTAVGGITPKYRMAISTIKSQAGVTEVLLGDVIKYSYYQYRVDYLDASYAYFTTRVSLRGTAGTSVTIASISESTEDGGSNIVTFSDDKTLTVKNGLRGGRGKSAYEHARDGGYTGTESEFEADLIREVPAITQDMGNSEKLVMSQAAVTNAFNSIAALPYGGSKEWLEANGDRTKLYQIDGYVWGYIESNGWTKSGAQFLVVSKTSDMVNAGGTEYLLRNGSNGTVYSYTEASGDVGVPVYSTLPTTAKAGDIVAVGGRKYKASVTQQQVPNWTKNYANPSDADWGTDKRIGSDGTFRDCAGSIATNFIPITAGDVVRVKGLDLVNKIESANAHYMGVYKSDKTIISVANLSTQTVYFSEITETTTGGQATLKSGTQVKYARFGGKPNSTANDIIVTINEEITYRTESTVKWTDIGEYITPVEAGWNATDRTYSVIDSLTATATSGSSAVYSVDGYVYSYISGADWASISKYTPQSIHIDNVLSDTSANTVQNKVVTAELDSIKEDVQENTNDIITLQNAVESLGAASTSSSLTIPSYWESTVTSKTETVKALQVAGGRNCVCFTWASDTHIPDNHNTRTNDIGKVMAKVMDNCNIPFAVLTGDVNTRGSYAEESGLIDCQNQMPIHLAPLWGTERLLMSMGNHDGAWGDSSGHYRKQQSPEKMWEIFFRIQALDFRRVFSNDGLYFYVDNIAQKTRFIILNSHFAGDYAVDSNGWAVNNRFSTAAYGQEQLDWLADEALNLPDGYGAVLFAHTPPEADYPSDASQLIGIVNAYNNKTAFNKSYTAGVDGWNNSTIDVNFASAKGEIIAMFAGHVHWDKVITTTMACPLITILSAGAPANAHQMEEGAVEPTRTPGTATETSFDVVTINRATRTIHCTRVGGGSDRVIPY